jgi:hypothetical protein
MSGILLAVLCLQDPFQQQIDDSVRQFDAAAELDQALAVLSAQLVALGTRATNPIARRLAQDLRDGMVSAAAPAFIDALTGRPDALVPLQTAFRDATTSAAGRVELAEALLQLDDAMSWRAGILAIATDADAGMADRARALRVLAEADDPQVPPLLRSMTEALPSMSESKQREFVDFLLAQRTPLSRELLLSIALDERLPEGLRRAAHPQQTARAIPVDPAEEGAEASPRRSSALPSRTVKKKETGESAFFTMPTILAGGVTLVLLILLLVEILRKG